MAEKCLVKAIFFIQCGLGVRVTAWCGRYVEMQVDRVVFKDVPVEVEKINVREVMVPFEKIVYKDVQARIRPTLISRKVLT